MIKLGFIIDLLHILSMRMLIMSCPWALFESKFCITFSISFSVNVIFDKDLSVLGCRKEGISLPLSMIEHCLAKKELNNSAFSLKFVTNLFSCKIVGIQGIFRWGTYLYVSLFSSVRLSVFSSVCRTPYLRNRMCKMMIFPGIFSILTYLRNSIAYDHDFWYTCVKWWHLQTHFSFFCNFYFLGKLGGKRVKNKNSPKWRITITSVTRHISRAV